MPCFVPALSSRGRPVRFERLNGVVHRRFRPAGCLHGARARQVRLLEDKIDELSSGGEAGECHMVGFEKFGQPDPAIVGVDRLLGNAVQYEGHPLLVGTDRILTVSSFLRST